MKTLLVLVATAAAIGLGVLAFRERARADALEESARTADARTAALEQEVAAHQAALQRLSRQPLRIFSAGARVQIECDEPVVLRAPLSPEINKDNPRIGTLIRLVRKSGEEIPFGNTDLSASYEDIGNYNRRFTFQYEPLEESLLTGRYLPSLADIEGLVVSYGAVMNAVGFCSSLSRVTLFELAVNDLTIVSLSNLGSFGRDPARYDVSHAFRSIEKTYTAAIAAAER